MKVLCAVKRVVDYAVKPRVAPDGLGVLLKNIKMSMNPFCEIAVEQAVQLKEAGVADEVIAVSVGPKQAQETLRTALAMGADRAIHIQTDMRPDSDLQPLAVAKILAHVAEEEEAGLFVLGKQAIDDDSNQTGQMVAGLLDWPQATFLCDFKIEGEGFVAEREVDGGIQRISGPLPCVITTDLRLNEPRYATLPNIMKAKKKKIATKKLKDLDIDITSRHEVLDVSEPAERSAGIMVEDVDDLMVKLKEAGAL